MFCTWEDYQKRKKDSNCNWVADDPANADSGIEVLVDLAACCTADGCEMAGEHALYLAFRTDLLYDTQVAYQIRSMDTALLEVLSPRNVQGSCSELVHVPHRQSPVWKPNGKGTLRRKSAQLTWKGAAGESVPLMIHVLRVEGADASELRALPDWDQLISTRPNHLSSFQILIDSAAFQ